MLFLGEKLHGRLDIQSTSISSDLPIVIIDAGHGGEDGGAIGTNGIYEKDINLNIANQLDTMLRAAGVPTVMTRSKDHLLYDPNSDYEGRKKVLDMQARLNICKQYEHAIFVSIHQNTFGQERYHGLQVYYSANNEQSKPLAQAIQSLSATSICPGNNRKIKNAGTDIFLLDRNDHPAVLVECGFLSNPEECEKLSDESYQKQVATTICVSILNFFEQSVTFKNANT